VSGLRTLVAASMRSHARLKVAVLLTLGLSVFLIAGLIALVGLLVIVPQARSPKPNTSELARYLGLVVYGSGLLTMGLTLNVFTANNLVKEKNQRLFESVLAAPVGARTLWLARTLAVFLPGLALCEVSAAASLLVVNAFFLTLGLPVFAPASTVVCGLLLVPVLYFPLCGVVLLTGLCGNPVSGNVIANVALSAVLTLVINLVVRAGMDVGSFSFALVHLTVAGGMAVVLIVLQPRLTKERIVLSSRM
jgi:ABC-2 type transport system permease protein